MSRQTSPMVADQVHKDSKQPRFELSLVVVLAEPLDDSQESFLHKVLCEFGVSGGTEGVTKEPLPVGIDQRVPGGSITCLTSRQKFGDGPCVHVTLRETPACGRYCPKWRR